MYDIHVENIYYLSFLARSINAIVEISRMTEKYLHPTVPYPGRLFSQTRIFKGPLVLSRLLSRSQSGLRQVWRSRLNQNDHVRGFDVSEER